MSIIRLTTGVSAGGLALIAAITMVFSMSLGVSLAYAVDSPENATIEYNGTHLIMENESSEVTPAPGESIEEWEPERDEEEVEDTELSEALDEFEDEHAGSVPEIEAKPVQEFAVYIMRYTLHVTSTLGSLYAEWFAHRRDRIPQRLAELYVASYAFMLAAGYVYSIRRAVR